MDREAAGTAFSNPVRPIYGDEGSTILGPANPAREAQGRDRLAPPSTDQGTIPNLKWTFAESRSKLGGGWARQATVREMPAATKLACVNMRLGAGVVREMHWHKPAEWACMIRGRARVTAVDGEGCTFQADVDERDLRNFPTGIPHSIQGLAREGCEFLPVFDDGSFDEDEIFPVTDFPGSTLQDPTFDAKGLVPALDAIVGRCLHRFPAAVADLSWTR